MLLLLSVRDSFACDTDSSAGRNRFLLYAESAGHNYMNFSDWDLGAGHVSFNLAYRQQIVPSRFYLTASAGWGAYKAYANHKYNRINFFPFEVCMELGVAPHFVEIGFATTRAYGDHELVYLGSHGSTEYVIRNEGVQFVPRIGYLLVTRFGLVARVSFTPHLLPKSYDSIQNNSYFLDKPQWIPFGVGLGWTF